MYDLPRMTSMKLTLLQNMTTGAGHTLFASWILGDYTVYFDANGGSVSQQYKTVIYSKTYGELPTPTRTGYAFIGWYTAPSGGTQVTASTTVTATSDHTLYAQWTANTYTVELNADGDCVYVTVTYGSPYGDLPTPNPPTGYSFSGWYTAASGGTLVTSSTTVTMVSGATKRERSSTWPSVSSPTMPSPNQMIFSTP